MKAWAFSRRTTRSMPACWPCSGDKAEPEKRPVKTARERELGDLTARRRQLIANITAEKNRLEHASKCLAAEVRGMVRILENRVEKLDAKIDAVIALDAKQHQDFKRLQSVPDVGPKVARTLIIDLPELGQLDRRRISSLAGLAPYAKDSGQRYGSRRIHEGGAAPRTALYLAALVGSRFNPLLKAMYDRLWMLESPRNSP